MNAALKVVHLVDEGAYLVERTWGQTLEVDGMPAPQGDFVVKSLDSIRRVVTPPAQITGYESDDGTLPVQEYQTQRAAAMAGAEEGDDGRMVFPSLEAEFEYRRFMEKWKTPIWLKHEPTREPVECVVTEVRVNSGDPDIASLWNAPSASDVRLYKLGRDSVMVRTAMALCAAADLQFENNPTFHDLRFAKIDGAFAFDDSFRGSERPFVGTLEQCQIEKAKCVDRVTRIVEVHAAKKRGVTLRDAAQVVLSLEEVARALYGVSVKAGSTNQMRIAREKLRDVILGIQGEFSKR